MTRIKTLFASLMLSCLFFVASSVLAVQASAAPQLYFDPSPTSVANGSDVTINLRINTDTANVFGADAVVNFPSSDLNLKSVTNGGFFSDFTFAQSSGKIEIHGYFSTAFDSKSGSGNLANIILTGKKDSGSGTLTFTCSGNGNDTEIIDSNGNNILSCNNINQDVISYGSTQGEPNSCGGTCGSNYNCQANYFCYQGFCRNPICQTSVDCSCKTPAPTTKPTPKVYPTPTMEIVTLAPFSTKSGYFKPSPTPTVNPISQVEGPVRNFNYLLYLAGFALAGAVIFIIIHIKKKSPPKISPPYGI